jgi:magnesium-transporting ATPase (P-type)
MTDKSKTTNSPLNDYWSRTAADLLAALGGTPAGLGAAEARARLERTGPNALKPLRRDTALRLFLNQFTNPLVLILIFAAIVSAIAGEWTDAVIVVVILFASAILTFSQESTASHAVEKLRARVTIRTTVVREGKPCSIPTEDVVPGDIVLLSAGSLIPADGIVLACALPSRVVRRMSRRLCRSRLWPCPGAPHRALPCRPHHRRRLVFHSPGDQEKPHAQGRRLNYSNTG